MKNIFNEYEYVQLVKKMGCYFVRHSDGLGIEDRGVRELYEDNVIGIHFENIESINPDDYKSKGAKNAINAMNKLSYGGYIWAEYRKLDVKIGKIEPQKVKFLRKKERGKSVDAILKTLKMDRVKTIYPNDDFYLEMISDIPRRVTMCGWRKANCRLSRII